MNEIFLRDVPITALGLFLKMHGTWDWQLVAGHFSRNALSEARTLPELRGPLGNIYKSISSLALGY